MVRILIVEDDQPFADVLAFAIRLEGHDVMVASSAEDGIETGLTRRPDIIIADWMLGGGLHGGDVCRRIQAAWPSAKTVVMTGYLKNASEIGRWFDYAESLLEKPFHKEAILEIVNQTPPCTSMSY
jgi:DNA-binding response OmpR family regulator